MKIPLTASCLFVMLGLVACGSDDSGSETATPEAACKSIVAEACSKIFGCLTDAQLELVAPIYGNNEADCRTKVEGNQCDPQMLKCDSDKTYDAAKADECLQQYRALSCAETGNNVKPAACEQICH